MSKIDELEKIESLLHQGILSQEEFEMEKKKILDASNNKDITHASNDNIENNNILGKTSKDAKKKIVIKGLIILLICSIIITLIFLLLSHLNKKSTNDDKEVDTINNIENGFDSEEVTSDENNIVDSQNTNFIEEIYKKYSVAEGCICSDGDEYWLLDSSGKKVYFDSVESFEEAMKTCGLNLLERNVDETTSDDIKNNLDTQQSTTSSSNEEFIKVPTLSGLSEKEAIKKAKELGVPYEIKYTEDVGEKEGVVLDQTTHTNVITNRRGKIVAAYSVTTLKKGETLAIIVNKYNDRTIKFEMHIGCLVELYQRNCKEKGITPNTTNYKFNIKINGKNVFSQDVSKSKLIEIIKKGLSDRDENYKEFDSLDTLDASRRFGDCGLIQTGNVYTGYGVFECEITVNGMTMASHKCDLYHEDTIETEKNQASLSYTDDNNIITFDSMYLEHGGAG